MEWWFWRIATIRVLAILSCTAGCLLSAGSPVRADDLEQIRHFFQTLRDQQLFELAERYALDRQAETVPDSAEAVQFAIELSRTFAAHAAVVSDADEQEFLLQRAEQAVAQFDPKSRLPRIDAVTLERAFRIADRAQGAWWEWTAEPDDEQLRRSTLEQLTRAISGLDQWVEGQLDVQPSSQRPANDLTQAERKALRIEAEMRRVELLVNAIETTSDGVQRDQWLRTFHESAKRLQTAVGQAASTQLKLFSLRAERLRGDEQQTRVLAKQLMADRIPEFIRMQAAAELVRFDLDQKQYEAARRRLQELKQSHGSLNDQLRSLSIEAELGSLVANPSRADEVLRSAEAEQQKIVGPWRLRSGFLLQQIQDRLAFGEQAEPLVRRGRRAWRNGQREEAISSYEMATAVASTAEGKAELAFLTASLQVEVEDFEAAFEHCREVISTSKDAERRVNASLLAAYCAGKLYAETRTPDNASRYETALTDHLRQFGSHESRGDSAWMLGSLLAYQSRPAGQIQADRLIPQDHPRFSRALDRDIETVLQALSQLTPEGSDAIDRWTYSDWMGQAERLITLVKGRLPARPHEFQLADLEAGLSVCQLLIRINPPRYQEAYELLERLPVDTAGQTESAPEDKELRAHLAQSAESLKLVCLCALGRFADAAATLERLRSISNDELLAVLDNLSAAADQLDERQRTELARLQLSTISRIRLQGGTLTEVQRQRLNEYEAHALRQQGRFEQAARMYASQVQQQPVLIPQLADSLEKTGKPDDLKAAHAYRKSWESKQKQGTPEWLEARLKLAESHEKLGEKQECLRLIRVTRLVYPKLGSPALKAAYDALEARVSEK